MSLGRQRWRKAKILNQKVFPVSSLSFPYHWTLLVRCSKSLNETKVGVFFAPSLVLEWWPRGREPGESLLSSVYSECIQEHLTPKLSTMPILSSTFSIIPFVYLEESCLFLLNDVHGEQSWPLVNIIFSTLNKPILLMACPGFPSTH